jgi:hypothetical protein
MFLKKLLFFKKYNAFLKYIKIKIYDKLWIILNVLDVDIPQIKRVL